MIPPTFGYAYYRAGDTVYHIEDECPEGSQIPESERVAGRGTALTECVECRRIRNREAAALKRSNPTFGSQ